MYKKVEKQRIASYQATGAQKKRGAAEVGKSHNFGLSHSTHLRDRPGMPSSPRVETLIAQSWVMGRWTGSLAQAVCGQALCVWSYCGGDGEVPK
jgi:hypothetical protein